MTKPKILFTAILIIVISGLEFYAKRIKDFAINLTDNFEPDFFEVTYNASILESSGGFVNTVMIGALICGVSTLLITKRLHILLRIGIILLTIISFTIALVYFNNTFLWKLI